MTTAIDVQGLGYECAGRSHRLTDVHVQVERGEVACILGPNGAGKSTLLRCLLGLLKPTAGSVQMLGQDLAKLSPRERAQLVAYVPQDTATAFPYTVLDIAVMGRTPHLKAGRTPGARDRAIAFDILTELGVGHLCDRTFTSLSGGQRSLVLIARALVQESEVLVLDEPTAALDLGNSARVLRVVDELAARGRTVLMTTHQPDHALHGGHRAILVSDGSVIAHGPSREVLTSERLSDVYGTPVHIGASVIPGVADPIPTCFSTHLVKESARA